MITFKDFLLESSKTIDTFLLNNVFKHNLNSFNEFKKTNKTKYDEITEFLQPYINCLGLFVYTEAGQKFLKLTELNGYNRAVIIDTLNLIKSLSKSIVSILENFLHIASSSNISALSLSSYELSNLSEVDTDILQYIMSLEVTRGKYYLTVDKALFAFTVQIDSNLKFTLTYYYNTKSGIVSKTQYNNPSIIIESDDELEIIEAFNKELKSTGILKNRIKPPKMDDDAHKDSLHLYVKDQLNIIKYGGTEKNVNISNETIDKQFDISLKINDNTIQLILPFVPVSNTIFQNDKYDLFTLVHYSINHNIKFPRFFVDVYDRYGTMVSNEPIDLLNILCYGDYALPTLDNLERLTGSIEGYFVKINKKLVSVGTHEVKRTNDSLLIHSIPTAPLLYMCLEKDVHGNYIVTNRESTISRSFNDCDTFVANKKDIKPYVFVKL